MKNNVNERAIRKMFLLRIIMVSLILGLTGNAGVGAVPGGDIASSDIGVKISLNECVKYTVVNSFEAKLAKLDLFIAETGKSYSQAVFDTFLYGGIGYSEDKRQQLSVFSPDDSQTNTYYGGITKTLPTGTELDVKMSENRAWNNSAFVSKNPSHSVEMSVDVKQPVAKNYFGYTDRANISITKLAIESADLETKIRIEELIASTEKAYWDLVSAKRTLEIIKGIRGKAKDLYEADKKNKEMGLKEKVDVLASEANLAKIDAEVLVAENRYKNAEEILKLLMNLSISKKLTPIERLETDFDPVDLADSLKEAFEKRLDYQIANTDIKIKGIEVKIKRNNKWPEIDLVGSMIMNGVEPELDSAFDKATSSDNIYYYAGVEVTIPIENNLASSEYDRSLREKEKALVQLKQIERSIVTEVGNAYRDVITYRSGIDLVKRAVQLQSEKLTEEEKRFGSGRSTTKRIIDYQRDLLNAEMYAAGFLLNYRKAVIDLNRTINNEWERYGDVI